MLRPRGTRLGLQAIPVALISSAVSVAPARFAFKASGSGTLIFWILNVMKTLAAGNPGIQPPAQISSPINGFKMIGIYAGLLSTKMIQIITLWRHPFGADVKSTVSQLGAEFKTAEPTITSGISGTAPQPTTRSRLNRVSNPVVNKGASGSSAFTAPSIMLLAEALSKSAWNAFRVAHRASIHEVHHTPLGGVTW